MGGLDEVVAAHVADFATRVAEARETACEQSLQSGRYGVLESHHADGSVTFELSAAVPFGQLHEKRDAY